MRWVGYTFWGMTWGINSLAALLLITMCFHWYGVFWMVWDATYSIWCFVIAGAIVGISFGISKHRNAKIKFPRRVERGRYLTTRVYHPNLPVNRERG